MTRRRENKGVIFKNCAPFTDCINEIKNTQQEEVYGNIIEMSELIEYKILNHSSPRLK